VSGAWCNGHGGHCQRHAPRELEMHLGGIPLVWT
jgi:hypothetical protein